MTYQLLDVSYGLSVGEGKAKTLEDVLKIVPTPEGRANNYTDGSTIIINSDRLILNSKKDSVLLCGKDGVTISSPKKIHLDCDDDLHIFSGTEVYIGLPNKGDPYDFDNQKKPKNKAQPTVNARYEPLVLGLKLANLLQDFIVLMKNAVMVGNSGQSFMSTQMMYNLACLQARVPEIMSTYAFIDGVSHDGVDPEPPLPAGLSVSPDGVASTVGGAAASSGQPGSAVSSNQAASAGPSQNNTSGTPAPNPAAGVSTPPNQPGSAPPVVTTVSANPTAPSQNADGPAPSEPAVWVPGQFILSGTETGVAGNTVVSSEWSVRRGGAVDTYEGRYKNAAGVEVVWIGSDLNDVTLYVKNAAKQAVQALIGNNG